MLVESANPHRNHSLTSGWSLQGQAGIELQAVRENQVHVVLLVLACSKVCGLRAEAGEFANAVPHTLVVH